MLRQVKCPLCNGKDKGCRMCDGLGEIILEDGSDVIQKLYNDL
jgi:hypothetical protein|tara:strand:- start:41 stop:169 length:129 start_codon:yes stop_codon:yes gene_type:complete